MISVRLLAGAIALGTLVSACGGDGVVDRANERVIMPLDADFLPPTLLGLSVEREDIADILDGAKRPYLDAASLYSLREDEELQATLQIGRFSDDTDPEDEDFRDTLLGTVGAGSTRELLVGDRSVYLTTGDRQQVAVWFEENHMLILSTREEFERPRDLLRAALAVEL